MFARSLVDRSRQLLPCKLQIQRCFISFFPHSSVSSSSSASRLSKMTMGAVMQPASMNMSSLNGGGVLSLGYSTIKTKKALVNANSNGLVGQIRNMSATSRLKKWKLKKHGKSLKTRSSVKKRFIITGTGSLKHGHCGKRHNTGLKSTKITRRLNKSDRLEGTQFAKNIHKLLINRSR